MGLYQNPTSFSSQQQLLRELETLISIESDKNGNPWMSVTRLKELFYEKYGVSVEDVLQAQGFDDSLRSFLVRSRCFSIYGTSMPQNFYVALLQAVVPGFSSGQTRPIQYRVKRPWKVDRNLLKMLEAEGAKEIGSKQFVQPLKISIYQPSLASEIKTVDDLEITLVEIIKSLAMNHPEIIVTVSMLTKKFYAYYGRPIRAITKRVCPNMRLIDLLRSIPGLQVKEIGNGQITLKVHLLE